ncbi:MAG: tetratricopeptide repeat protein [Thermoflexales bacterium]|nr:tetratricopeptide repeat protein [Thermoflexales bacterium]
MVIIHFEKPSHSGLAIYLFGRPEFRRDDELLPPLATHKTQSLLAYLILHRHRPRSRDELATLFWGDRDDVHARRSLATALWHIRRALGESYLLADSTSVQFNPASSFSLDVAEFEEHLAMNRKEPDERRAADHLRQAVDLYRGDLLEGFYDDWCLEERYRLEALYLDALGRLVSWYESQGHAGAALAYAQKCLAHDPLMEHIHLAAMRALVALGDVAGARRQWQRCCETRWQELYLPPSPEMLQQAESILGAQFVIPLLVEPLPARAVPRRGTLERPPFVGRAREMAALQVRWERAVQGQGGLVLIGGEAGVGKTRLAEEFAAMVRWRGGIVARGRCYEPEHMFPYQPLAEALRDLVMQEESAVPALPAWVRGEVARLLPEMAARLTSPGSPPVPLRPEHQDILVHAVATFIRHFASRTPLLIVLEDLHWATDSTLAAIHYLVRQIGNMRVLCLGTFRPEEIDESHALATMAAQWARDGLAQHLALERLSEEAIDELVRHTLQGEAGLAQRLYAHTEGNAFFAIETLRALAEIPLPEGPLPVPGDVRALIESRLGHLSGPAREWLACAAVAGRAFDYDLVRCALGVDEDAALETMDELLRRGFLCEGSGIGGQDYEFVHHLVQEATYTGIHHRRRRRLHRRVGEAMEGLYADEPTMAGVLAHHFDAGGEVEKALHYHRLAAQRATAVFAWQEAEEHQDRILRLLEEVDPDYRRPDCLRLREQVLSDRAESRYLQAHLAERDADLASLEALAGASGDAHVRLKALSQRARYLNLDAQYRQAIVTAEEGLTLAERLEDTATRCYLLTQIGFAHYFLGQPRPALAALESALAMAAEGDRETRRHILHILGYVHFHLGNYARALGCYQECYADHEALGDYNGLAWAGLDIGAVYQEMGRPTEAREYLTEHLTLARRIGARSAEAYGLIQLGSCQLGQGDYGAAADCFRQALVLQEELRTEHGRVAAEMGLGFAFYHLGDGTQALHWLGQAAERARPIGHRRRLAEALVGLGLAEMAAGQPLVAQGHLSEAVAVARESESRGNLAAALAALARAERRSGDAVAALGHASEAVDIARELAISACEMWAELEVGLALLERGDPAAALEHTGRAVQLVPQSDEGWIGTEQAYYAYAHALRALGRAEEADEQTRLADAVIAAKAGRIPEPQQRQRYLEAAKWAP